MGRNDVGQRITDTKMHLHLWFQSFLVFHEVFSECQTRYTEKL